MSAPCKPFTTEKAQSIMDGIDTAYGLAALILIATKANLHTPLEFDTFRVGVEAAAECIDRALTPNLEYATDLLRYVESGS